MRSSLAEGSGRDIVEEKAVGSAHGAVAGSRPLFRGADTDTAHSDDGGPVLGRSVEAMRARGGRGSWRR